MDFRVTRRGAAIVSAWLAGAGSLLLAAFWRGGAGMLVLCCTALSAVCFFAVAPRLASCSVRVGGNHLTVRQGLLFLSTKRLPLRFVTGCRIFQTPLCRAAGVCVLLLFSSGTVTLVAGARLADAEALAARISHGGKLV